MSSACTPILVGVVFSVSEILLPSKTAKFPFRPTDYSPWSSKNLIDRNRPKKFMQVGVDVKCMYTTFGMRGFSGFGDFAPFRFHSYFAKFLFWTLVQTMRKREGGVEDYAYTLYTLVINVSTCTCRRHTCNVQSNSIFYFLMFCLALCHLSFVTRRQQVPGIHSSSALNDGAADVYHQEHLQWPQSSRWIGLNHNS